MYIYAILKPQLTMTDSYAANGQGLTINGYDASLDVSDTTNYLTNGHDTNGDTRERDNVIVVSSYSLKPQYY